MCRLRCDIMEGVPGSSAVIEPGDLRFHVKIAFLVSYGDFLCFAFRQICVLNSGKIVFCIQAKVTYCWHSLSGMG